MNKLDAMLFDSAAEGFSDPLVQYWLSRGKHPKAFRVNDNDTKCFVIYLGNYKGQDRYL